MAFPPCLQCAIPIFLHHGFSVTPISGEPSPNPNLTNPPPHPIQIPLPITHLRTNLHPRALIAPETTPRYRNHKAPPPPHLSTKPHAPPATSDLPGSRRRGAEAPQAKPSDFLAQSPQWSVPRFRPWGNFLGCPLMRLSFSVPDDCCIVLVQLRFPHPHTMIASPPASQACCPPNLTAPPPPPPAA